ncbi:MULTISPECIES: methyl-accepting chemotaxis protein [Novosphingobium]|uniref:methyl-accepting chemotaxis protein n=1 Tax=unclassified Novosphingobium TaxID=2644732 RepID=UPI0010D2C8A4|nr:MULTISPECIES: cache domain-containing protein [unclassified Novosphingobium]TCM25437.1 methyl-accepting chemotaxis sensory transducer [Novosphingobium sp. ST904]
MTRFREFLNRQHLSAKVTLMAVAALVLLSAAIFLGTRFLLVSSAREQGTERLDTNMRVAWSVLRQNGLDNSLREGRLYAGEVVLNDNNAAVDRMKELVGGTATIFMGDTRVATNVLNEQGGRALGSRLAAGPVHDEVLDAGKPYRGETEILGKRYFAAYDPIKDRSGKVIGILFVGVSADEFYAHVNSLGWNILLVAVLVTALAAAGYMRGARKLFAPLETAEAAMGHLAEGQLDIEITGTDRPDEIGGIARALVVFRDAAIAKEAADAQQRQVVQTLASSLAELSSGDLTAEIARAFPDGYEELRRNYNAALSELRGLIGAASASTAAIRGGSFEIAQASEDLARRTEASAASLEQSSAALAEIDNRLKAGANAASQTVARADEAIATVGGGRDVAAEAVGAMRRVAESATNIDSVIEGLDKIAFQTRVLAMNAAVEAGRAGEAGRGFAVVADLVSALAMRSEEEARSAREQLTVTQAEIVTAVGAVERVDGAFENIAGDVGQVHQLLGGMAAGNRASATSVSEITAAIGAMNIATQQNAAMVEQASAAARSLTDEVDRLTAHASQFKVA